MFIPDQPLIRNNLLFDHLVLCSVGFDSFASSDRRVHARGWG